MTPLPGFLRFHPKPMTGVFLTLVFAAVGGALFDWLTFPLAWLAGAMVFTTVAALAGTTHFRLEPFKNQWI